MKKVRSVVYGPGGFDPNKPDGNVLSEEWIDAPPPTEVDALRTVARMVASEKVKAGAVSNDDAVALSVLYDPWVPGGTYAQGDLHAWDGTIIECLQPHTNHDPNHTPDTTPALWKVHRKATPAGETPPEWVQPTSTTGYAMGERVTFNGNIYESTYDGLNVWSPETYPAGWRLIE